MLCSLCGGEIERIRGDLQFSSKMLGEISVPGVNYEACMLCGDITVSYEEGMKVNRYLKKKENETLKNLPFKHFITPNEAADLLGITKQAFSKHSKIKRGFIYSAKKGGRNYFLKESVLKFKQNNKDGRINLQKEQPAIAEARPTILYIPVINDIAVPPEYERTVNAETVIPLYH